MEDTFNNLEDSDISEKKKKKEEKEKKKVEKEELSLDRSILAFERAFLAWIRTAASLMTFGFAIFKLRESGLSCTEIASRLDVTRQYVSKILKGLNKPHIKAQWEKEKGLKVNPSNP